MCFYVILLTKLFRFYKKLSLLQITYFTKAAYRGKLKLVMSLYIVKNEKCEDKTQLMNNQRRRKNLRLLLQ